MLSVNQIAGFIICMGSKMLLVNQIAGFINQLYLKGYRVNLDDF